MATGKYQEWLTPDGLLMLEAYARDGMTDEQIAKAIGIAAGTLYDWKKRFPEISEAIKKGKAPVDFMVENALLKRALGFNYEEKTYERVWNDTLQRFIKVNTKTVTKMVTPDTGAAAFWLKNRKPARWRDKPEDGGDGEQVIIVDDL